MLKNLIKRRMFIQTVSTPNQNALIFKPGCKVLDSKSTIQFNSLKDAKVSPLASNLFKIDGVSSILFAVDFISITKLDSFQWSTIKPDVYSNIMNHFSSGNPILQAHVVSDTDILPSDSETVALIKELIETRIRPTIQEDGGDVMYCGFENGIVKLNLMGACKTCSSSVVTLKNGIENMMMHYIPEVKGVEQILDEMESVSKSELEKMEKNL